MIDGARVEALRLARGLSMSELARSAGLERDTLYKIKDGARVNVRAQTIVALAEVFGTTADFLLGLTNSPLRPEVTGPSIRPDLMPLLVRLNGLPTKRRAQLVAIANLLIDSWRDEPADRQP